jgi:hypothetical protein
MSTTTTTVRLFLTAVSLAIPAASLLAWLLDTVDWGHCTDAVHHRWYPVWFCEAFTALAVVLLVPVLLLLEAMMRSLWMFVWASLALFFHTDGAIVCLL